MAEIPELLGTFAGMRQVLAEHGTRALYLSIHYRVASLDFTTAALNVTRPWTDALAAPSQRTPSAHDNFEGSCESTGVLFVGKIGFVQAISVSSLGSAFASSPHRPEWRCCYSKFQDFIDKKSILF